MITQNALTKISTNSDETSIAQDRYKEITENESFVYKSNVKGCLLPLQIILLKQIEGKFSAEQTLKEFTNTQLKNIMKISLFAANILCQ